MPRDWPDPRWPDDRPTGWIAVALATVATLYGVGSLIASFWPG